MESDATILAGPENSPGRALMRGGGVAFSGRPWRVQDFDISVVCGIDVKLCHNLPLRGFDQRIRHAFGGKRGGEKSFVRAGTRDGGSVLTATGRAHGPSSLFALQPRLGGVFLYR